MPPTIYNCAVAEPHLTARLAAAGDLRRFDARAGEAAIAEAVRGADALLLHPMVPVGEQLLAGAPDLKVVATTSVGFNTFDVDLLTRHGVALCNTPIVLNDAVADLTIALRADAVARSDGLRAVLAQRGLGTARAVAAAGARPGGQDAGHHRLRAHRAGGGAAGAGVQDERDLVRRLQRRRGTDAPEATYRPLDDLLRESDFVTLHTNLTPGAPPVIGERELSLMRPTAYLINTSRGPIVDQAALTAALRANAIAGAGLDVLEDEPPDPNDPIVTLPNVITFPHIGTATEETRLAMREMSVDNLLAVLAGEPPRACVNPSVLG